MHGYIVPKEDFSVKKIITVQYFEYANNYVGEFETHDFYELIYIDKGEAEVCGGETRRLLASGEATIHIPGVRHNISATGKTAPNVMVIGFECNSPYMDFVKNAVFGLCSEDKKRLADIMREAKFAFSFSNAANEYVVGAEQLVKISLEMIIINLYRGNVNNARETVFKERVESELVTAVKEYLNENVHEKLEFADVVSFAKASSTTLKCAFKKCVGMGVMAYFANLKIERAKQYIREENYNFTEISRMLSYDTPHRFSKQFKSKTGMTPTEYANSVKMNM